MNNPCKNGFYNTQILRVDEMSQILRQLWCLFLFYGMILSFRWQGYSLALPGTNLGLRTRVGRIPTSYPTASSRR